MTMEIAYELFEEAFNRPRDLRSAPYKEGVLAELRWRMEGARSECSYKMGTVEADAFVAGLAEGLLIYLEWKQKK